MLRDKIFNFLRNIKFLFKYSLYDEEKEIIYQSLIRSIDLFKYEISEYPYKEIKILDYEETVDLLLNKPKSFCRIGDGEINIIQGRNIEFQEYDKSLAEYLLNILRSDEELFYIGLNYHYFHSTNNMNEYSKRFYLVDCKPHRDFILNNCNLNNVFIAAGFNQVYMSQQKYDFKSYYKRIKKLFWNRKLVVFVGESTYKNYNFSIFELAAEIVIEKAPSRNSFRQFKDILSRAKNYSKDFTLCFMIGPTSKALVYELSREGFIAWDLGHLVKDYNAFCMNMERNNSNIKDFYAPD